MSALTMALVGCGGDNIANNPLVQEWDTPYQTPPFSKIELKHYEPAIDYAIELNRADIDAIVNNPEAPTFENTIVAMERAGELLNRVTGVFFVLNNCDTHDQMQESANMEKKEVKSPECECRSGFYFFPLPSPLSTFH